jgi:hypothetical protein
MRLEWLLAGPILRRTEPTQVCVWLATSVPADIRGEVVPMVDGEEGRPVGAGVADTVRMGPRLFFHLVRMHPEEDRFPTDRLLAYDLLVRGEAGAQRRLRDLGLLNGPTGIAYGDLSLPTFFIRHRTKALTVLHGSCRQLHGGGTDALAAADGFVARYALDPEHRPCSLFLTGDQIYADDVPGPLVRHLEQLGRELIGAWDDVPGIPAREEIRLYGRTALAKDAAGFTSPKASNHLFRLGEFAAMYVTAWNELTWPEAFPMKPGRSPGRRNPTAAAMSRRKYRRELQGLERTRSSLPAVRRLLANIPTYMVFDDHDVTDDWNITGAWRSRVESSPAGRRAVANALGAYWAFQGWGNDPDRADGEIRAAITGRADGSISADEFDTVMWSFDRWSFVAPTEPPTLFLDTRTRRGYDSPEGGARLIRPEGLRADAELARTAGHQASRPLVVVSPVPICGLEIVERRQKYLVKELGPYAIDFEAWHSNLQGFVDLIHALLHDLELPWVVVLSGDVHYGFTVNVTLEADGRTLPITQLVSSPIRHSGAFSRFLLAALGLLTRERHERVGWDRPPAMTKPTTVRRRLLARPSNTDDWNDDAPVFVAPTLAESLGVTEPPRYREWRQYASIEEAKPSLIGLNNVGLVSMADGTITHRLLAPKSGRTRMFSTRVDATTDDSDGETRGAQLVARDEGRGA